LPTSGDLVRSALASRRGRGDGKLYARATPKKVEITESYSVTKEISGNPMRSMGPRAGQIEMTIPYDGHQYFTRQAIDDVEWGIKGRPGNDEVTAVIGHLRLTGHTRTDLRRIMRQYHNVGVIPIEVPVSSSGSDLDHLTADRQTCLITHGYQPDKPEILPVELDVQLYDPDSLNMYGVKLLSLYGEADLAKTIDRLRQEATFRRELEMNITVRISIPVRQGAPSPRPRVKLISVDWPAITSLRTTQLDLINYSPDRGEPEGKQHPVRYNPVQRRLEWEDVPVGNGVRPEGSPGKLIFDSLDMLLKIGHPGDLFTAEKLNIHAEVEIPDYLLSGLEARLFDATGNRQNLCHGPKLTTRISIDTEFYVSDIFAKRKFWPYQQLVFDDVVPSEMRITDIGTVLRNSKFEVEQRQDAGNLANPNSPKWLLSASRRQGPDELELLIAVEGEKYAVDRQQIMGNNRVKISGSKESGRMRLSVLGTLPRDHADLTREMNYLQQSLRDRFRFQQTS
jgi:hypothetical protein